jgi:hypothetical protein
VGTVRAFLAYISAVLMLVSLGSPREGVAAQSPPTTPAEMKAVVREWDARLNARDNAGLALLFALPALLIQGPDTFRLTTHAEVAEWFSGLPCAGQIVSIAVRGRAATAVFRLANRGPIACDAPGTLAAARFEIVGGKIASWEQVPVPAQPKSKTPAAPIA